LSSALDDGGKPDGVEMKPEMVGKMKIKNFVAILAVLAVALVCTGEDSFGFASWKIWGWTFGNV
jgi:hypothetical protein